MGGSEGCRLRLSRRNRQSCRINRAGALTRTGRPSMHPTISLISTLMEKHARSFGNMDISSLEADRMARQRDMYLTRYHTSSTVCWSFNELRELAVEVKATATHRLERPNHEQLHESPDVQKKKGEAPGGRERAIQGARAVAREKRGASKPQRSKAPDKQQQ